VTEEAKDRVRIQSILDKYDGAGKLLEFNYYDDYRFPGGYLYELTTSEGKFVLFIDYDAYRNIAMYSHKDGILPNELPTDIGDKVYIKQWVQLKLQPSPESLKGLAQLDINRKKYEYEFDNNDNAMLALSDGVVKKK
jgi:hypothetical protein